MQLLSRGQPAVREELHACDASLESREGGFSVCGHFVDGLDDEADALSLPETELVGWLEHAVSVFVDAGKLIRGTGGSNPSHHADARDEHGNR